MVQLKKKAVLLIGALMLLLGMGMNLQYALDDYGLADNNAVIAVWAQQTKTGDDPAGTGDIQKGCRDCNLAGGRRCYFLFLYIRFSICIWCNCYR